MLGVAGGVDRSEQRMGALGPTAANMMRDTVLIWTVPVVLVLLMVLSRDPCKA